MAFENPQVRCLFFDVFGTCVDWRTTVTDELSNAAKDAINSPKGSLADSVRTTATGMTYEQWGEVAQEWRMGYLKFTSEIAANPDLPYKTVDDIHLESIQSILTKRGLILSGKEGSLWDEAQVRELNFVWHRLKAWPDTCQGLTEMNKKFTTCTLTNGNLSLIQDMAKNAKMPFTHLWSAEMFNSYKPNAKVYLGGPAKMGLKPEECAMVAAHLDDLKFAKSNGLRTVYVARRREEGHPELENEGIPDIWVKEGEGGFVTAAERLGVEVSR